MLPKLKFARHVPKPIMNPMIEKIIIFTAVFLFVLETIAIITPTKKTIGAIQAIIAPILAKISESIVLI